MTEPVTAITAFGALLAALGWIEKRYRETRRELNELRTHQSWIVRNVVTTDSVQPPEGLSDDD